MPDALPDNGPTPDALEAGRKLANWMARHIIGEAYSADDESCRKCADYAALALDAFRREGVEKERPTRFLAWAVEMFGPVALEPRERALRFIEEAIELSHAMGIDAETMQTILDRVYSRPAGEPTKEAAQSLACLECLAVVLSVDLDKEADAEFARVQTIPRSEWTRRHAAKVALGFAGDR